MLWVTRAGGNVDRVACPWLIKHFIDAGCAVPVRAARQGPGDGPGPGGRSYDAKGAEYTHQQLSEGEICSFATLVRAFKLWGDDPALDMVGKIVNHADTSRETSAYTMPEGEGLEAIARGFALLTADDHQKLAWEFPLYDALYAYSKRKTAS